MNTKRGRIVADADPVVVELIESIRSDIWNLQSLLDRKSRAIEVAIKKIEWVLDLWAYAERENLLTNEKREVLVNLRVALRALTEGEP